MEAKQEENNSTLESKEIVDQSVEDESDGETGESKDKKYYVHGLDKNMDDRRFRNLLKTLQVPYKSAQKLFAKRFAIMYFEDEEQRKKASDAIAQHKIGGKPLEITTGKKRKSENANQQDPRKKQKYENESNTSSIASPETIQDVVTPYWKIPYEEQLKMKSKIVLNVLYDFTQRVKRESANNVPSWAQGGKACCPYEGIKASPVIKGYRNKLSFTIGMDVNDSPCIGFSLGKTEANITAVGNPSECLNVSEDSKKVRDLFQSFVEKSKLKPYDKRIHEGFWRNLTVRTNKQGDATAIVQVNPKNLISDLLEKEKKDLVDHCKQAQSSGLKLMSLLWQQYEGVSNAPPANCPFETLFGSEYIFEELLGLKFRVHANSFFQVNTAAAEVLYSVLKDWAKLDKETILLDVCCGTGTIGLCMAKDVKKVVGVEIVAEAVHDARSNASLNGITNAEYVIGKAEEVFSEKIKYIVNKQKCVAIVDPPRAGLHHDVLKAIRACPFITSLIFVSCEKNGLLDNGPTLCRMPTKSTKGAPFTPVKALCVDMFPHSDHQEIVMLFERDLTFEKKRDS